MIDPATAVVVDVNVYLDYILGDDGSWSLLPDVPPTTDNPAADAVSLAFAVPFRLFASPHILRNVARVMRAVGQQESTVEAFVAAVAEMCEFSGGAVIEPEARSRRQRLRGQPHRLAGEGPGTRRARDRDREQRSRPA